MPITIWYTIDLFFRDWDKRNADSALWLSVQPNIELKYLKQWLPDCGKLSASNHKIWTSNTAIDQGIDVKDLVPVPFPGDADARISLTRGGTSLFDRLNERQRGPHLTNPAEFELHNRPRQPDSSGIDPHQPVPVPVGRGIYAQIYAEQLADAYRGALEADPGTAVDRIADMLQLAFHGGTTRHISDQWFSNLDAVHLLKLEPATEFAGPGVMITNIHSLLGMQFLVAERGQVSQKLATPGTVSLTLHLKSADTSWSGDFAQHVPNGEFEQWFDWFAQDRDVSANFPIQPVVLPGFDQRIYVHDAPEAFSKLGGELIWRRRSQEKPGQGRSLADAKRFIIRPARQADDPPVRTLSVPVYTAIDCDLRPYRSFKRVNGSEVPLRLRPKPQSRDRFLACFTGPLQPQDMVVLDEQSIAIQLEWLGAYDLPWDAVDDQADAFRRAPVRTVLFWGPPAGRDVTVLVPASSSPIDCTWLENTDQRYDPDQLGRRWESVKFANAKSGLPFDAFSLSQDIGDIAAGVIFPNSLNFVSARSVEAVEGVLTVTYPYPDIVKAATIDPASDYAHDLVNYNALNVRDASATACSGQLLNPDSSDYAVWHSQDNGAALVDQTFHYRFAVPGEPDVNDKNLDAKYVREFFDKQFSVAGHRRPLDFELVHTYGTSICLGKLDSGVQPHARLPMLPNEVSSQLTIDGQNTKTAFLWVSYDKTHDLSLDQIVLSFDNACLSIPDLGVKPPAHQLQSARMRMVSAFRSLAEIGYAGRATLTVRGCNFDYTKLVGKGPQAPLAEGLIDNDVTRQWSHDLSTLAARCRDSLDTGNAPANYPILLTKDETARFRNCNLIEFSIGLERTTDSSPIEPSQAVLLRIGTDLGPGPNGTNLGYDREGQRTEPAESAANLLYGSWQGAMSGKARPVVPERGTSQAIRDVFSAGGEAGESNQATAWIAPPGAPAVAGEWPELYFFPLGFLPLERSRALGAATTTIVRRFFDALASVVDARPGLWNLTWSKQQWSDHFKTLETNAPSLLQLLGNALALVKPAHRAADVDKPVAGQITNFLSASEQARWTVATSQLAISAPGVFGSAKGFQVTAMGAGHGAQIRSDLFQIIQEHNTTPEDLAATKVRRTTDIRQGLPGSGPFFGLEVLDDVAYGDRYAIGNLVENSFEKLIDDAAGGSNINIKAFLPSVPGKSADRVALPSREPLVLPHHLLTGSVAGAATPEWWKPADRLYISSKDLVEKFLITPVGADVGDGLHRMAGGSGVGPSLPASRLDRFVINAVFRINSDEEGSFANDTFSIRYSPDPIPSANDPQDNKLVDFFEKLLSSSQENNEKLHQVADLSNITIVREAVKAAAPGQLPKDTCRINLDSNGALVIQDPHTHDGWCISAALYRIPQTGNGVCRAYLIVTFNVPVWQVATLGLYHSRNIATPGVPAFAPDFGQTLGPAGSDVSHIPYSELNNFSNKTPLALPRQPMTAQDLIQKLVDSNYIDATQWKAVLAEVTIHHRQKVQLMADDGSGEDKEMSLDIGKYALVRCEHSPTGTPTAIDVFPNTYEDFFVDFIWHQNGKEFLRIVDFPVTISHTAREELAEEKSNQMSRVPTIVGVGLVLVGILAWLLFR